MTTIHVTTASPLAAETVLAAAHDFSARRAEIFPAVSTKYLQVHQLDRNSAEVTEGTRAGVGVNWERCHYDWSTPNTVTATVRDSNVYQPGTSSWQLRATPAAGNASTVEMIWIRQFRHGARGRIFGTLFKLVGKPIFTHQAKQTLTNLQRLENKTPVGTSPNQR
jgi:hypothetical protein